jgi:hypothetical protein
MPFASLPMLPRQFTARRHLGVDGLAKAGAAI